MKHKKIYFLAFASFLTLAISVGFTNCAPGGGADLPSEKKGVVRVEGLPFINYFREPIPDRFCGQEGYGYLLRSYIGPECGSCHSMTGGMFPPFGDKDLAKAYSYGKSLGKEKFLELSLDNRFCGPDCDLDIRGEIYQALNEWFDNTDSCN